MKLPDKAKSASMCLNHIKVSTTTGTFEGALEESLELAVDAKCDVIFTFNSKEYHVSYKALRESVEEIAHAIEENE